MNNTPRSMTSHALLGIVAAVATIVILRTPNQSEARAADAQAATPSLKIGVCDIAGIVNAQLRRPEFVASVAAKQKELDATTAKDRERRDTNSR